MEYPPHIQRKIRELAAAGWKRRAIYKHLHIRSDAVVRVLGKADRRYMFSLDQLAKKSEDQLAHPHPRDPKTGRYVAAIALLMLASSLQANPFKTFFKVLMGNRPLVITTSSLPNGAAGTLYSAVVNASGGKTPYTWSITAGSLPHGLMLTGSTVAGMPVDSCPDTFTVQVRDRTGRTASQGYSIVISSPLLFSSQALPDGQVGQPYSYQILVTGGCPPYSFALQ